MEEHVLSVYFAVSKVRDTLDSFPDWVRDYTEEKLKNELAICRTRVETANHTIQQLVTLYSGRFGMPPMVNMTAAIDFDALQKAELDFNDTELRTVLFVPKMGIFAKHPKAADYIRLYNAAIIVKTAYQTRQEILQTAQEARQSLDTQVSDAYLQGVEIATSNASVSPESWKSYPSSAETSRELYIGDLEDPVENTILKSLGQSSKSNEEAWLKLPFSYDARIPFRLFVDYEGNKREGEEKLGALFRDLIYQIIHALPPYSYQIVYLDPARSGAALMEIMSHLRSAVDGNAYRLREELYPDNNYKLLTVSGKLDDCRDQLHLLENRIERINEICGGKSVREYNSPLFDVTGSIKDSGPGVIPHLFIFVDNTHGVLDGEMTNLLCKLSDCAGSSGMSLVMGSIREARESLSAEEKKLSGITESRLGLDRIEWKKDGSSLHVNSQAFGQETGALFFNFSVCPSMESHEAYLDLVSSTFRPTLEKETNFVKRIDLDNEWGTNRADRDFSLPLGVNERDQVVSVTLGGSSCAHAQLAGSTGSGKSWFLHALINSVVVRYKPTDIQIWLSDYKGGEFRRYIQHAPPHITYVGVARSMEYTLNFLDRIYNEYTRRIKLFEDCTSLEQYRQRHGTDSMPRLFVIIDEFHVMSQHVAEKPEYKQKLTSLLREMRAYGMTLLLSDQTYSTGLRGLADDAMQQIGCRMAMALANPQEYKEMFPVRDGSSAIPIPQNYEVVVQRMETKINSEGKEDRRVYYERCKTLALPPEDRDIIWEKSVELYGHSERPVFIEEASRGPMDWNALQATAKPNSTRRGFPVYLGTVIGNLAPCRVQMIDNDAENLVSIITDNYMQVSIFISELESVLHSGAFDHIYILADYNDALYSLCEFWLADKQNSEAKMRVITQMDDVCDLVRELHSTMIERRLQKEYPRTYVFWMGLQDISRELEYYPKIEESSIGSDARSSTQLLDDLDRKFSEFFREGSFPAPAPSQETATKKDSHRYNVSEHIRALLEEGPKRGIHHFVFYSALLAAKRARCAPLDRFVHKTAAGIGDEDAAEFFGRGRLMRRTDDSQVEKDMAVYFNGIESYQYKPFLSNLEKDLYD